jgi:hypothetical protein
VADSAEDNSDLVTASDINPILDNGCLKSAGGLENIVTLSLALGIPVKLAPLDCPPFYHGYGEECSNARFTIGIWNLPLCDLNGQHFQIPFYVFQGSGPLLLGNSVLHHLHVNGPENLLIISPEAGLAQNSIFIQTYTTSSLRTRLHVVPCRKDYFLHSSPQFPHLRTVRVAKDPSHQTLVTVAALLSDFTAQPTCRLLICESCANAVVSGLLLSISPFPTPFLSVLHVK